VKEQYKEQLQNELTLLQLFEASKIPLLPRIIDMVEDFLVIQPLGDPFTKFSLKSLTNFIKTLKEVHKVGYIHRDIRSTNLIQYHDDVYLIDWGFACKIGENIDFAGKLFYASNDILESPTFPKITTHPSQDLHMFLKMLYLTYFETDYIEKTKIREEILALWKDRFIPNSFWQKAYLQASELNYEALLETIYVNCPHIFEK